MVLKKIFLAVVAIASLNCSLFAQKGKEMIDVWGIRQDVYALENRITSLIKKDSVLSKMQELQQFNIIVFKYNNDIKKSEVLDLSFLYRLQPRFFNVSWRRSLKTQNYLFTETYICDSNGQLLSWGSARSIYAWRGAIYGFDDLPLVKLLLEKKADIIFCIGVFKTYIAMKDDKIWGIRNTANGLKEYSLEDFIDYIIIW
ncbi:MAG: hypothetical protein LBQ31_08570 [Bacteroidales bacterium]|jgi:hypothetical protein|nr:hypothetical protein [Bacteroidales bacterium]